MEMIKESLSIDNILNRLTEFFSQKELDQYDNMLYAHSFPEEEAWRFLYEQVTEQYKLDITHPPYIESFILGYYVWKSKHSEG